jgi:hypothetical protein
LLGSLSAAHRATEDEISTGGYWIPPPGEARLPVRPTPWLAHGTIGKPVGLATRESIECARVICA